MYVRALVNHCGFYANKIYLIREKLIHGIFAWYEKENGDYQHLHGYQYEEVDEATARRERPELFEEEFGNFNVVKTVEHPIYDVIEPLEDQKPFTLEDWFKRCHEKCSEVINTHMQSKEKPQFLWKGYNSEAEYLQACIDKEKEERLKILGNPDSLFQWPGLKDK